MAVKFVVPSLGNEIGEGMISEWLKAAGDTVAAGEPVVVVETPKLNLEVEAPVAGRIAEILRQAGDIVEVGATLAIIDEG